MDIKKPSKPKKRTRRKKADEPAAEAPAPEPVVESAPEAPAEKPKRTRRKKAETPAAEAPAEAEAQAMEPASAANDSDEPKSGSARRGWWQRTFGE